MAPPRPRGESAATAWRKHYLLRTSWVVGEGKNFVATMASLAERGVDPAVVSDQWGAHLHPRLGRGGTASAVYRRTLRHLPCVK